MCISIYIYIYVYRERESASTSPSLFLGTPQCLLLFLNIVTSNLVDLTFMATLVVYEIVVLTFRVGVCPEYFPTCSAQNLLSTSFNLLQLSPLTSGCSCCSQWT